MPREILANPWPLMGDDGAVSAPKCCDHTMEDDGGCPLGCCDDFRCKTCGRKVRVKWPD